MVAICVCVPLTGIPAKARQNKTPSSELGIYRLYYESRQKSIYSVIVKRNHHHGG